MDLIYKKDGSGGVIRFDRKDWLKGLTANSNDGTSNPLPSALGDGLMWMNSMNPLRRPGFATSGPFPSNLTNVSVINGYIRAMANVGLRGFAVGGVLVHEVNLATNTITNSLPWPHTISGATQVHDTVIYNVGGNARLFYSYNTASGANVGMFNLAASPSGSDFDDDYMTTVPSGGFAGFTTTSPPKLIVSPRTDRLYMVDGRSIHYFDGQAGLIVSNRFQVPAGYIITSFALKANYLVVYAYKESAGGPVYAGDSIAVYWDEYSDDARVEKLNASYVDGGFVKDGVAGCFVRSNDFSQNVNGTKINQVLMENENGKFAAVFSYNSNDSLPSKNGVFVSGDSLFWNSSGVVWQLGSLSLGFDRIPIRYSSCSGTDPGVCIGLSMNTLFTSSGSTTSGGLQHYSSIIAAANFKTFMVDLDLPDSKIAKLKTFRVNWGQYKTSGQSALIQAVTIMNGLTTTTTLKAGSSLPTRPVERYTSDHFVAPQFQSIGLTVAYNDGTEYVKDLELHFDFENYS